MGDDGDPAPLLEWGPAGWQRRVGVWLVISLGSTTVVYLGLVEMFGDRVPAVWPVLVLQPVTTMLPWVLARQRSGLRVDSDGITVRGPAAMRGTWRWDELLEVAAGSNAETGGPGVAVRPQGSTWDTPGPLAPVFAHLRRGVPLSHVQEVLARECARHGVPFTTHAEGFGTARPGSALRRDT